MNWVTYDTEVYSHDFIVIFKNRETKEFAVFHNDNIGVKDFINDNSIYCGFNSKGYDQYIIKAICAGFSPEEVKQVNDWIIGGGQGWEYPPLKDFFFRFNNVDIKDDMQMGLSLKAIEGHLGMSVEETSVSFDIDRPLTEEELKETVFYCKHDVDTTEKLVELRKDYLKNKIHLGKLAGLDEVKAMGMTNAKLTAAMLKATKQPHDDERKYVYPDNLRREYIPQEVFDFFDRMYDPEVSDKEYFSGKLEISIGECPVTIGFGGIHGAIPNFLWDEKDYPDETIKNEDVGSYYPHLCTINGYTSRNIPSPQIYEEVLETRMKAKAAGDTSTANALKLVCNTTYGCLLNQYNDLYDPLMGRSVCISGQLYLLELAMHCYQEIPGLRIVQLNTDGIMVLLKKDQCDKLNELCREWQDRTQFELEEDVVSKIAQKDVNNYVEIQPSGKSKSKGGYLVRGIAPAGAFNINNNACIVATALKEYFVNGTPVEETINGCDDIFQFQLIAKAGAKYREAYHLVDGEKVPVQKVNRVYATADTRYGKLFKVKAENDATAKIEMLPEHCIIDNDNHLSIEDVDRTFYIEMARKRINDFLGIKPERKRRTTQMATTTKKTEVKSMNVFEKLLTARVQFLNSGAKKTGKNMHLAFKYFELDDIVPIATGIFAELRLLPCVTFNNEIAKMDIIDIDNPSDVITFTSPMRELTGNNAVNAMQALGSTETYQRRYLYMMALDICEPDNIEPTLNNNTSESPAPAQTAAPIPVTTPTAPQTSEKPLTTPDGNASPLQIKQMKELLKKLKDADPTKEEMIAKIAVDTKSFTVISKADCETLIVKIGEMLEGGN